MHITIIALGSYGDVRPLIALAVGLRRAGYRVRIAAFNEFAGFVDRYNFEFASITGDPREVMEQRAGQEWLASGSNSVAFTRGLNRLTTSTYLEQSLGDSLDACQGTDGVIYSMFGAAGYHVAEMMRVPSMFALLQPFTRTREFPSIALPSRSLGGWYNWLTHRLSEVLIWQMGRADFNRWRSESLGLDPIPFSGPFNRIYEQREPYLYGFSEHVVPRPHDWPDWHTITGYWFLDDQSDWSPPGGLGDFINGGSKPIYIGFGSMSGPIARQLTDVVIEAVSLAKVRAVLLGGWAQIHDQELPDHFYALESAPHAWLFPRMAAVVHHGGAGTTGSGLRAGVPSVIVPFFADQPYWGRRVHALGAGPKPVLRRELTAQRLAGAIIDALTNEEYRQRAAGLGEKIRAEDGVARAVSVVDRIMRE